MRLSQDRGLTLVELAVAILILSIGTLAAMRSLDQARVQTAGAEARTLAQVAARNRAEELRLLGPNAVLPDAVDMGKRTLRIETVRTTTAGGLVQARITARATDGAGGAQVVVYLSPGGRK
ncbi:MAG: type II secretion system protein [Pseudomonadota bacterium]